MTDAELVHQQRELSDQLFKMKFQLKMGQTESLKKIRELKKDIARIQTVMRQKELAGGNGASAPEGGRGNGCGNQRAVKTRKAATKKAATEKK